MAERRQLKLSLTVPLSAIAGPINATGATLIPLVLPLCGADKRTRLIDPTVQAAIHHNPHLKVNCNIECVCLQWVHRKKFFQVAYKYAWLQAETTAHHLQRALPPSRSLGCSPIWHARKPCRERSAKVVFLCRKHSTILSKRLG